MTEEKSHIKRINKHKAVFPNQAGINKCLQLADDFLTHNPDILFWTERNETKRGVFYRYKDGVYKEISNLELENIVIHYEPSDSNFLIPSKLGETKLQEVIKNIKKRRFFYREDFNQENIINFRNGFFDIVTGDLLPHDISIISTVQLPYNYDPQAKCPIFFKTIQEIFENDAEKIQILQEFLGYCLTKSTKYEKALFMVGAAQSGKSTILETIQAMLGEENVSSIGLAELADSAFVGGLIDKYANLVSEIPKNVRDYEDTLKMIISGERLTVNTKFVPTYTARPFCKLIFAANDMPRISDTSNAVFRRMLLLEFNNKIEDNKVDVDLKDKLKTEYAGVFNWAFDGLKRLNKRKGFTKSLEMDEVIEQLKIRNNTTLYFLNENYELCDQNEGEVIVSTIYREYAQFCIDIGAKPLYINNFSEEIKKLYGDKTSRRRKTINLRQEQCLYGLRKKGIVNSLQETINWD